MQNFSSCDASAESTSEDSNSPSASDSEDGRSSSDEQITTVSTSNFLQFTNAALFGGNSTNIKRLSSTSSSGNNNTLFSYGSRSTVFSASKYSSGILRPSNNNKRQSKSSFKKPRPKSFTEETLMGSSGNKNYGVSSSFSQSSSSWLAAATSCHNFISDTALNLLGHNHDNGNSKESSSGGSFSSSGGSRSHCHSNGECSQDRKKRRMHSRRSEKSARRKTLGLVKHATGEF